MFYVVQPYGRDKGRESTIVAECDSAEAMRVSVPAAGAFAGSVPAMLFARPASSLKPKPARSYGQT